MALCLWSFEIRVNCVVLDFDLSFSHSSQCLRVPPWRVACPRGEVARGPPPKDVSVVDVGLHGVEHAGVPAVILHSQFLILHS